MRRSAIVLILTLLAASALLTQTVVGSIGGVVQDASGAVVDHVKVTVTDEETHVTYTAETNGRGNYLVPFLKPGSYGVAFEKTGFERRVSSGIAVVLNQEVRLDATLEPGSITQSVTVEAKGTLVNRVSSEIGTEVGYEDLINQPESIGSHGASVLGMIIIFPGVSSSSPDYSNPNNISLGGGRPDTPPIIIDGLPSNMGADNTYGLVPTPYSTEELQVLTVPFSAQYGQTGGGAILTTTKAGTMELHGALFETHNDQALNALNFFSAASTVKTKAIFNNFGGAVGGPVYIPKVFNGKKHLTFFFTDWEDTIEPKGSLTNTNVPTAAELQGNFSGPTPQNTAPVPIYDPATTQTVNGKVTRSLFPGNIIPANRIDPVGAKIASFFPAPNCDLTSFNFCVSPTQNHTYLYNTDRIDENISDYDKVWFRFARDGPTTGVVPYFNNAANPSAINGWKDYHAQATWSHIFSPSMANEFRFGMVQEDNFNTPSNTDVPSLGLTGVALTQFPDISVSGLFGIGASSYSQTRDRHWIWNDALTRQVGRHHLQMGGEFMRYLNHVFSPGVLSGSYSFTGTFTSLPGTNSGYGLADLLLGLPATTSISINNYEYRLATNYASLYFQDDYKVTSKLTVNLGLRWEFDGPPTELNGQNYTFNPSLIDPTTGKLGAIQFAGVNGAPRHFIPNDYRGFLPRFGFAYSLPANTVVRGGYGIYELPSIGFITNGATSKYSTTASFTAQNGGATPYYELDQGVPAYSPNVGANGLPNIASSLTSPTQNVQWQQLTAVIPYLQEWQFGIEHQFKGWLAEVDYEGNRGAHLPITLQENQIYPSPNCCFGVANSQSLRPYPQWLNVARYTNDGNSNYNALITKLQHAWKSGLSVLASYTWAKMMDDVDASARADAVANQNVYNLRAQYGIAMIDIPQRFTFAWVYDLPLGSGGKVAKDIPVLSYVVGHWQVSGNYQAQIGYPYNVTQANDLGLYSPIQYTNQVGNPNLSNQSIAEWFNPKAFAMAPVDSLGNTPRASLFGPGQNNWNIAVARIFPIRERINFRLRAEFYDAFNHPQWNGLNTTITSPAFGSVTSAMDPRTIQFAGRIQF